MIYFNKMNNIEKDNIQDLVSIINYEYKLSESEKYQHTEILSYVLDKIKTTPSMGDTQNVNIEYICQGITYIAHLNLLSCERA